MVNRQEQEKRFLEWVKARDDDWWEDEARISIWDFRVMQEFFNEDLLNTLTEFEREKVEDKIFAVDSLMARVAELPFEEKYKFSLAKEADRLVGKDREKIFSQLEKEKRT